MKLAVAYCRVSTDHLEQKKSIIEQKEQWKEYFQDSNINFAPCGLLYKKDGTKEHIVSGIYADEGISGTSLRNRKAFNQMIEDANLKKFDMIYVEDTSRFSRSVEDGIKTVKDLRELGIGVFFRKEGWDTLKEEKDFEYSLRVTMDQEESRVKSGRLKWAINRLHKKGGWNSNPPYGYDIEKAYLRINDSEAEIVKLIFSLYIDEGYGTGKIVRLLNSTGVKTKKGMLWRQSQVCAILDNKIYTGEQRTHTVESSDITRHTKIPIPYEEQIVNQFEQLRIIDDDTFQAVKLQRSKRRNQYMNGTGHSNKHLLSTLLYCSNCGGTYKRKRRHTSVRKDGTSKDIGYEWTCGLNDMYGKSKCGCRNSLIEEKIIKFIKDEVTSRKADDLSGIFSMYFEKKFVNHSSTRTLHENYLDFEMTNRKSATEKTSNFDVVSDLKKARDLLLSEMRLVRQERISESIDESTYLENIKRINKDIVDVNHDISRFERQM